MILYINFNQNLFTMKILILKVVFFYSRTENVFSEIVEDRCLRLEYHCHLYNRDCSVYLAIRVFVRQTHRRHWWVSIEVHFCRADSRPFSPFKLHTYETKFRCLHENYSVSYRQSQGKLFIWKFPSPVSDSKMNS